MKAPKAPTPPDPNVQAAAQTQYEKDTATYNNAITHGNTYTPLGSSTYTGRVDPVTGATVYDQTISLDPSQQQLLDLQNQQDLALGQTSNNMLGRIDSTLGQPMDTSGLPGLMGAANFQQLGGLGDVGGPGIQGTIDTSGLPSLYGAEDLLGARQQTADALYQQQAAYLDPQYQQREAALQAELANKGISLGSEAYNNLRGTFDRARSFDYGQARNSAITGSGAEMSRLAQIAQQNRGQLFGERATSGAFQNDAQSQYLADALARAGFANDATQQNNANAFLGAQFQNQARAQGLDEMYAARAQPLNEFSALRGATQVDVPQFAAAQNSLTNPADIAGYMGQNYANQLDAYKARQASRNAVISGLFGLGAAGIGAFGGK